MSYNYLFACSGDGPGNLAPVLTAARRLRRRGHEVRVIAIPTCGRK
jgi:UDP:flavonoid glycosyltransferase YjiC (YdhE family)